MGGHGFIQTRGQVPWEKTGGFLLGKGKRNARWRGGKYKGAGGIRATGRERRGACSEGRKIPFYSKIVVGRSFLGRGLGGNKMSRQLYKGTSRRGFLGTNKQRVIRRKTRGIMG